MLPQCHLLRKRTQVGLWREGFLKEVVLQAEEDGLAKGHKLFALQGHCRRNRVFFDEDLFTVQKTKSQEGSWDPERN